MTQQYNLAEIEAAAKKVKDAPHDPTSDAGYEDWLHFCDLTNHLVVLAMAADLRKAKEQLIRVRNGWIDRDSDQLEAFIDRLTDNGV